MSYWFIKTLLVLGLFLVGFLMMRPTTSAGHLALRRLAVMAIIVLAAVSVIFPEVVSRLAQAIGVTSGVNLLVYILVLAMFTQMAIGYRRDAVNERKLTRLARAIALNSAPKPPGFQAKSSAPDASECDFPCGSDQTDASAGNNGEY